MKSRDLADLVEIYNGQKQTLFDDNACPRKILRRVRTHNALKDQLKSSLSECIEGISDTELRRKAKLIVSAL